MANDNHIPLYIGQPVRPDVDNEELGGPKLGPHHRASDPTVLQTDDPRFNPPTPSPLKRAVLLFSVFCLFWFALRLRTARPLPPSPALETYRFSADFDSYRPAISNERIKKARTRFTGRKAW